MSEIKHFLYSSTKSIFLTLLLIVLFCNGATSANGDESLEVKVKAAYLYNFLRFVQWPQDSKYESNICVYGIKESYRPAFNSMATLSKQGKKLNIKLLNVKEDIKSLDSCQIIFITDISDYKTKTILDYVNEKHSLTIGESSEFIEQGGMINFIRVKDKVRFEINPEAAEADGLKISSKVLRIAERLVSLNEE